ncbi:MAG: GYDIA family GHMP kinase [Croceivirga sp.]
MSAHFYSNGKLLLTAEYGVLDGALALAVPTTFGQSLTVEKIDESVIEWISRNEQGETWFEAHFDLTHFKTLKTSDAALSNRLEHILKSTFSLKPDLNHTTQGYCFAATLTFPRNWGLGSSSTLINNLAQWAKVNAYTLLQNTFGGSGYDIACAQNNRPIHYQLVQGNPVVESVFFDPIFKEQLYFIYLNKKQNSREAISNYRQQDFDTETFIAEISELTLKITSEPHFEAFGKYLKQHEELLSEVLGVTPVKEQLFPDYFGTIKSLGGWGGDFVLATGDKKTPDYFKAKGFDVVISYQDMVLEHS